MITIRAFLKSKGIIKYLNTPNLHLNAVNGNSCPQKDLVEFDLKVSLLVDFGTRDGLDNINQEKEGKN